MSRIASPSALQAALDALIAAARRRVRLYDTSLRDYAPDSRTRIAALRDFCLGDTGRHVEILVDDTAWIEAHCPRLMALLADFSHCLAIRTAGEADRPQAGFALGDGDSVLVRPDKFAIAGTFSPADGARAAQLHQQFDALWQRATPLAATRLGLGA
jgi:hypothetical protein